MRLNPHSPAAYLYTLGHAYYLTRRYEEAIETLQRLTSRNPDWLPAHVYLAAAYAELDRLEEARAAQLEALRISPGLSAVGASGRLPYKDPGARSHDDGVSRGGSSPILNGGSLPRNFPRYATADGRS